MGTRILDSKLTLGLTISLIAILCVTIIFINNSSLVPNIPSISWKTNSNALLITYRPDCGCGPSTTKVAGEGVLHHQLVILISEKPETELNKIKSKYSEDSIIVRSGVQKSIIEELSPSGKTTVSYVKGSRIVRQATGIFDYLEFVHQ